MINQLPVTVTRHNNKQLRLERAQYLANIHKFVWLLSPHVYGTWPVPASQNATNVFQVPSFTVNPGRLQDFATEGLNDVGPEERHRKLRDP